MNNQKNAQPTKTVGLCDSCQKPDRPQDISSTNPIEAEPLSTSPNDYPPRLRDYVNHVNYVHNLIVKQIRNGDALSYDYLDYFKKLYTE